MCLPVFVKWEIVGILFWHFLSQAGQNKLAILEATLVQNYDLSTDVECRATSVAKKSRCIAHCARCNGTWGWQDGKTGWTSFVCARVGSCPCLCLLCSHSSLFRHFHQYVILGKSFCQARQKVHAQGVMEHEDGKMAKQAELLLFVQGRQLPLPLPAQLTFQTLHLQCHVCAFNSHFFPLWKGSK